MRGGGGKKIGQREENQHEKGDVFYYCHQKGKKEDTEGEKLYPERGKGERVKMEGHWEGLILFKRESSYNNNINNNNGEGRDCELKKKGQGSTIEQRRTSLLRDLKKRGDPFRPRRRSYLSLRGGGGALGETFLQFLAGGENIGDDLGEAMGANL